MSSSGAVLALLILGCIERCSSTFVVSSECTPCDCYSVSFTETSLKELAFEGQLYTQAASNGNDPFNWDSACFCFSSTKVTDNVLVEQITTYKNKDVKGCTSIETTICRGNFKGDGPTQTYQDFILDCPCDGTYVIYRCVRTQKDSADQSKKRRKRTIDFHKISSQTPAYCVKDPSNVIVFIVSNSMHAAQSCIDKGIATACSIFHGLQFCTLPRTSPNPCDPSNPNPCQPPSQPVC